MSQVPSVDAAAVQAFESTAVGQVLATHDLPSSDASAVLGWGRNDVRAQEWLDLAQIIQEPATSRSANDAEVYDWFQAAYVDQQIAQAQDAIDEYQLWSGEPITYSGDPIGFGDPDTTTLRGSSQTIQTGYCNYVPPGGPSGPFANSYSGNLDPTCYPPYQCPEGLPVCSVNYPALGQFQSWGTYDAMNQEMSSSDYATTSLGTAAAIGVGASLAVAGVSTALSSAFGGAGIASSVSSELFPFAARTFYEFFVGGIDAATAGADAAAASASLTAGAIAFVVGIAIFFIVSTALAIVQIVQDEAIRGQLQQDLSSAQATTNPDLGSVVNSTDGYATLFALFTAQTQPDVDYSCSAASTDPCADAPTPPGQNLSSDPQFLVTTTSGGVSTTVASPTIYTPDALTATYNSTRLSGNGWFVSTKYAESPGTLSGPSGSPGATFESLQFPFTDWSGNNWMAERIVDSSGNPEFAVTPLDASTATACTDPTATSSTGATACITDKLDVVEPNGTDATVEVVPASSVVPSIEASVPASTSIGQSTSLVATGTDPSNLALSYSWLIECPGTYIGTVDGHTGYAGFPCDLTGPGDNSLVTTLSGANASFTFREPGLYPVTVTATDAQGYSATSPTYNVQATGSTTTTLAVEWPGEPSVPTFGTPVTYTATVTPLNCACVSGLGGVLYPGGTVQFDVDGLPYGAPVQLVQEDPGTSQATATLTISDLAVTPGAAPGHVVTAQYLPGPQYEPGTSNPPVPILTATQGFGSSTGASPPLLVSEGSSELQIATSWSTQPSPLAYGQPLDVSATVTPGGNTSILTPTGEVQFSVNGHPDGSPVQLDAQGQASTQLTDAPVTPPCNPFLVCLGNTIGATYVGDAGYQSSATSTNGIFVVRAATATLAGPSSTLPVSGQPFELAGLVTVTAPGQATPTGGFTFMDGTRVLGTAPISGSFTVGGFLNVPAVTYYYATLTTSLVAGTHAITVSYGGDATTAPSSTAYSQVVAKDASTAAVSFVSSAVLTGAPVHYLTRITAAAPGSGTPTGTATFYDGATPIPGCVGVALTASGTAACNTTSPTAIGIRRLTARYSGDADFTPVTSTRSNQTVLYGLAHFWRPLLEDNLLRDGAAIPVSFLLTNADGSLVTFAKDSALAATSNVHVVFSGPGVTPITTTCTWIALPPQHFSCDFTPPSGLSPGKWYSVTAFETVGAKTYRIPEVGSSSFNPVRIHFTTQS
jgi:hypothetical protein